MRTRIVPVSYDIVNKIGTFTVDKSKVHEPGHEKMCLMSYANNKAQISLRIRAV